MEVGIVKGKGAMLGCEVEIVKGKGAMLGCEGRYSQMKTGACPVV